jgi:superfamily II DNA helicase RecQ
VVYWLPGDLVLARQLAFGQAGTRGVSQRRRNAVERALETMRHYVTGRSCRRRVLLEYLGERSGRCSGCDRCGG